jgi:heptosyltransferase-2
LVVLAPNWLGDAVMALPLIADLRRAWPETEVAVAARAAVVPLFDMVPGITHTVSLGAPRGLQAVRTAADNARLIGAGRFDAAMLLPNSFAAAWMTARARVPERWGFARDWRSRLLTVALRPPAGVHQAAYYQALGAGLGIPPGPLYARVEVSGDDTRRARSLLDDAFRDGERPFVVMAPGAAYGRAKQWLPARFAELAQLLHAENIATVLVGARGDAPACAAISARTRAVDLCARTDLGALAAVLKLSRAVVSNDSGAMHIAAAVGSRVIAIFGPTDDRATSPLRAGDAAPAPIIVSTDVWCRPCMLRECPIDHRCMSRISAQQVLAAVLQ